MLFAYFGPETTLPLTSAIAAVAGFALMFGRQVARVTVRIGSRIGQRLGLRRGTSSPSSLPRPSGVRLRRDRAEAAPEPKVAPSRERVEA